MFKVLMHEFLNLREQRIRKRRKKKKVKEGGRKRRRGQEGRGRGFYLQH